MYREDEVEKGSQSHKKKNNDVKTEYIEPMGVQRKREINGYLVSYTNQSSEAPKKKGGRLCQANWRKLQCSL